MCLSFGNHCQLIIFPELPTGIAITGGTKGVKFSWGQSTGIVDGYRIYWGLSESGPYSNKLCDVNSTTLEYSTELNCSIEHHLVCRAYNEYGESGDSNEIIWPKQ